MTTTSFTILAPFAAWSGPLSEVPDEAFAQGLLGPGLALDPLEGVVRAPFDGEVVALAPTGHAITLRHASGAEVLIHVGIDTVKLAGRGFAWLTTANATVRAGDELLRFDLELVAREAKSLISPLILLGDNLRLRDGVAGRAVACGEPIATIDALPGRTTPHTAVPAHEVVVRDIRVPLANGLHARPSARIVALLKPFAAEVALIAADKRANARSVTSLLMLDVRRDDTVRIEAQGEDAAAALEAVATLVLSGMGEAEDHAAPVPPAEQALDAEPGTLTGLRASPGGAIGVAFHLVGQDLPLPATAGTPAEERAALLTAATALELLLRGRAVLDGIAQAHLELLADPDFHQAVNARIAKGVSAPAAWRSVTREQVAALEATGNPLLIERTADLIDIERQLLALLLDQAEVRPDLPENAIVIADELLPSAFFTLDTERLAGILTARGGPTSHAAILAAAKGLPMVVCCGPAVQDIAQATPLLIEADRAVAHIAPSARLVETFEAGARAAHEREALYLEAAREDGHTADGQRIEVYANCGSLAEAEDAVARHAEGCGLLRSEFLFLDRTEPPSIDEQAASYGAIARALDGRPLIVRTLDAGSDKPLAYLPVRAEDNPALGMRGIRLSLAVPGLLEDQFAAILRSVPPHQRRIMLPMVSDLHELRAAKALLRQAEERLGIADVTPLGVMIETPAAALLSDCLAREADFLSIGSNDLAQYALAADRQNPALAEAADALHPAVIRLIAAAAEGAHAHGRWLGICGGLASDPKAAALLVGLGVDELSASPRMVPSVKAAVRATRMTDAHQLAERALRQDTAEGVRRLIEEHWHASAL